MMPHFSGIQVLKALRETYSPLELPILITSSKEKDDDYLEAFELGANDYLLKPVNFGVAYKRVTTHLEASDLYKDSLSKKELSTILSMVSTYNHEINSPLNVALLCMERYHKDHDEHAYTRLKSSLEKIAAILKSIREIEEKGYDVEEYFGESQYIKLKK